MRHITPLAVAIFTLQAALAAQANRTDLSIRLTDGRLLLLSQRTSTKSTTALVYDPVALSYQVITPPVHDRTYHPVGVGLPDGRAVVAGGPPLSTKNHVVEVFDPTTRRWSEVGSLSPESRPADAVVLGNGQVLFVTATGRDLGIQRWDPATGASKAVGHASMVVNGSPLATTLRDGRVLITTLDYGGENSNQPNAYLYDPATDRTEPTARMQVPRSMHQATLLADGRVAITGGTKSGELVEIFDPARNSFAAAGKTLVSRALHAALPLADGRVVLASVTQAKPSVEIFDPAKGTSVPVDEPPSALVFGTGGNGLRTVLASGELLFLSLDGPIHFEPKTMKWRFPTP